MDPFMGEAHPLRYDSGIRTEMKDHDARHQSRSQVFTASVEELILIRATNRNRTPPVLLVLPSGGAMRDTHRVSTERMYENPSVGPV